MVENNIQIVDESGDKKYFTIVPNYILNHSKQTEQSLYLQMKRFAGETGECFASEKMLMQQMGVGRTAFKKSLQYLLNHEWISFTDYKQIRTKGGPQKTRSYRINDLWKLNIDYYEGVSKTAPLTQRGADPDIKGVLIQPTNNIHVEEELKELRLSPAEEAKKFFENPEIIIPYLTEKKIPADFAKQQIKHFADYWTEKNKSGTKQRWELQPTFEVKRRLVTWFNKNREFQTIKSETKGIRL